jgi:predicted nucleic acid-binding protein
VAYLLDTNILVRWINANDIERPLAMAAIEKLHSQGEILYNCQQNYTEFWAVATRPITANGFGLTGLETEKRVGHFISLFPLLPDNDSIFVDWLHIVSTCQISGRQVHDARLAAVMLAHKIPHILTFDTEDFRRYQGFGITAVHPKML